MNIEVKANPYRLRFFHLRQDLEKDAQEALKRIPAGVSHMIGMWGKSTRKLYRRARGVTICQIVNRSTGAVVGEGTAFCSPKDNYCKETGRRAALTRALVSISDELWDADERREVWEQYWCRGTRMPAQ